MEAQKISQILNAKIDASDQLFTIHIENGKITALEPSDKIKHAGLDSHSLDARCSLVLPGLIDIHTHIDKSFNESLDSDGTLPGAIQTMARIKQQRHLDTIMVKAEKAITMAIKQGVSLLCSHIDLSHADDLDTLRALLELKKKYANKIELRFTALGGSLSQVEMDLINSACDLGVDMIGGAPALSDNPAKSVENAVALSREWKKDLDLHIDEKEDTDILTLEILADFCLSKPLAQNVIASHCCTLAFLSQNDLQRVLEKVKKANISIVSLPMCNLVLMGRDQHPVPRGIAPIKAIQSQGINTCLGSDNVRDPFNPFGNYDPLSAVTFACIAAQMSSAEEILNAIKLVTKNPARALGKDAERMDKRKELQVAVGRGRREDKGLGADELHEEVV